MKLLVAIILAAPAAAFATPVIDARDYTCAEIQEFVEENNVVQILHGFGGNTIVSDRSFCAEDETANAYYTTSNDDLFCLAGKICQDDGRYDN